MPIPRATVLLRVAVSVMLSILLTGLGLSCGPAEPRG